jgi:hypothetical protein
MSDWTTWRATYTAKDEAAFQDPQQVDHHFELPSLSNVFSLSLDSCGRSNVHGSGKKGRLHYLGNYLTYRYVKQIDESAWIWDERYRFAGEPVDSAMLVAQREFASKFGTAQMELIRTEAKKAGLEPGGKTSGRPDLAVHFPSCEIKWRFIEIKMPGDRLHSPQSEWLRLFARHLGLDSAVVLEFQKSNEI